ncbi:MAG: TonB-dependent receptor [Gemmatimonadaceae bacterium]
MAPSCLSRSTVAQAASTTFDAPLDRPISIFEADLSLRTALDRIAAQSRVRLSYSADLLPVTKRVCLSVDRMPIGVVLNELLRETSLRAVVLDSENVVLAPSRGPTGTDRAPEILSAIGRLDRVVVTGTADGGKERGSAFAVDVLDGRKLSRADASTFATAFDGAAPGIWMWTQSPSNAIGRFGSVRGASSFGVTSPKIYVDGIEVANPLFMTQFDPDRIDRIEVIRGPQGAALYGADAISGVVNVITRHDGQASGEPVATFRTRAGMSTSAFAPNGAFVQDHSFGVRAGNGRRSFGFGATYGTVGNYIPGGAAQSLMADADVRFVGSRTVFTGIARYSAKESGALTSPLLLTNSTLSPNVVASSSNPPNARNNNYLGGGSSAKPPDAMDTAPGHELRGPFDSLNSNTEQSVRQYTVGSTATLMQSERWTHTFVAGVDGYRSNGVATPVMSIPLTSNVLLRAAHSEADRTTFTARSVARFGAETDLPATLTFGAEQSSIRQGLEEHDQFGGGNLSLTGNSLAQLTSIWTSTAGVLAQVSSSWRNSLFLSAGGRVERSSGAYTDAKTSLLPMLGAAWVKEVEGQTFKLRASYGKGIRPSNSITRAATWMNAQSQISYSGSIPKLSLASLRDLEPEAQSGYELGTDVLFGQHLGLHVTRFDQRATGLIQAVALTTAANAGNAELGQGIAYELQNVGAISNRGWEMQATSSLGRFSLLGNASFVDSRVQRVANRYGGELRVGDRMLEVPAKTFSLMATYASPRFNTSWTIARAMDWINYDQLAIAERRTTYNDPKLFTGTRLRNYWKEYDGATRLRGNVAYTLTRKFTAVLTGDNLFNLQRGEPDNVTIVPGRTLTLGLRTRF